MSCCVTTTQSWPPLASPVISVVRSSSLSWYENDDGGGGEAYNICFLGSAGSHTLPGSPQSLGRERDKASSSGCGH